MAGDEIQLYVLPAINLLAPRTMGPSCAVCLLSAEPRGLTPKDATRGGLSEREEDNERPSTTCQHLSTESTALLSSSELHL